jgi:hypothetical protein
MLKFISTFTSYFQTTMRKRSTPAPTLTPPAQPSTRALRRQPVPPPTFAPCSHEVQSAAEAWIDIFTETLALLVTEEATRAQNLKRVQEARELADRALAEIEDRWPGVKL